MPEIHFIIAIASLAAGVIASGFLYFRQKQFQNTKLVWLLFTLRALGIAMILFVLLAPMFTFKVKQIQKPILAVLVDNSTSMLSSFDSAQVKESLLPDVKSELNGLQDVDVEYYYFDDELVLGEPTFGGSATNMAAALADIESRLDKDRLNAAIIVSDGIVNRGANPLYQVENSFLPVYTIGVGDSSKQQDLAITDVRVPEFVFVGDEFVIEATVVATNSLGEKTNVALKQGGTIEANKKLAISDDAFAKIVRFTVKATKPGIFAYELVLPALVGERNTDNNTYPIYVEVIENRKKMTILASAPNPDVGAVHLALKKVDAYDVDFQLLKNSKLPEQCELVILYLGKKVNVAEIKNGLKGYNGPLWIIIHPLANRVQIASVIPWISNNAPVNVQEIKPSFNTNFGLFKLSGKTEAFLKSLNPINSTPGNISSNGTFEGLLKDGDQHDLASYGISENRRIVLFGFSGLWNLRIEDFVENNSHEQFDEWMQLTTQYLTSSGVSNRLKMRAKNRLVQGDAQVVKIEVYDAAFQQTTSADVNIELKSDAGEVFNYNLVVKDGGYFTEINGLQSGKYTIEASAKLGDETLTNSGSFIVSGQSLEELNTRANFDLLQQLAMASGGSFFTINQLDDLKSTLQNQATLKPIERIVSRSLALIDLKWLLFIAVLLFAIEWFLRRYFGRI